MSQYRNGILRFSFIGLLVILMAFALSSCANAPKESVELSKEVGKGIAESQRSYTGLLNTYFASKNNR